MAVSVNILNHHIKYNETTTNLYLPTIINSNSSNIGNSNSTINQMTLYPINTSSISINRLKIQTSITPTFKYYLSDFGTSLTNISNISNTREFEITINSTDINNFNINDYITIVNDVYTTNADLEVNGNMLYITNIDTVNAIITVVADLDTFDYSAISTGTIFKLYEVNINKNDFYTISNTEIIDYNLFIDIFWESIETSTDTFNSILIFNTEILNVNDITTGDDFTYYYDDNILMSDTSREIGFRKTEYGNIFPSILINDLNGTGNNLPLSNNYKFSYELNVGSLDSGTNISRNEASISGNYIDNILEFAETFSLKAISDIYEYISMLNIKANITEQNDKLYIESSKKINTLVINKQNNLPYIVIKNEDGIYFDSRQFVKNTDLLDSMNIIFDDLKTNKLSLYNKNEATGYIDITDNILDFSLNDKKIYFTYDTDRITLETSYNKFEILDDLILNNLNVQYNNTTFFNINENKLTTILQNNLPGNTDSVFEVISNNQITLIQSAIIDNIDLTILGSFDLQTSYNNILNDTNLISNTTSINDTSILVSSVKQFIKINTKNNMEIAGNDTLYVKFKNIIFDGITTFQQNQADTDITIDYTMYNNIANKMSNNSSIYWDNGGNINKNGINQTEKTDTYNLNKFVISSDHINLYRKDTIDTNGVITNYGNSAIELNYSDTRSNIIIRKVDSGTVFKDDYISVDYSNINFNNSDKQLKINYIDTTTSTTNTICTFSYDTDNYEGLIKIDNITVNNSIEIGDSTSQGAPLTVITPIGLTINNNTYSIPVTVTGTDGNTYTVLAST